LWATRFNIAWSKFTVRSEIRTKKVGFVEERKIRLC